VRSCFLNHSISLECGICGEMSDTRDEVRSCFFNHSTSLGCGICGEMSDTRDQDMLLQTPHQSTQSIDISEGN